MPNADKITIYTGDTLKVQYESLQADPTDANSYGFTKTEALPDSARAQVWDVTRQEFLEIGGVGTTFAPADVEDHIITYLLEGDFTVQEGSYKIFITAVYPDGQEVTEMRAFKIAPRS
jgi:hypothetical protein